MSDEHAITTAGDLTAVPKVVMNLAEALAAKHGDVTVAMENRGLHLYMASPVALERDGDIELRKRHLAVNADRYLGTGSWGSRRGTYDNDLSARCMKYEKPYRVTELLAMSPLATRGIRATESSVKIGSVGKFLVDDGNGNMIPQPPGRVWALTDLPEGHQAIQYLRHRGFDPEAITRQFGGSYCYDQNLPARMYRELPGGFRDTPQGRIIFNIDMLGVRRGWQARLIEMTMGDVHMVWHPYDDEWKILKVRTGDKWKLTPEFAEYDDVKWDPSKYKTGTGTLRNSAIMGLDAAIMDNALHDRCALVICEGPLDAARLGPPAVAILGKSMSHEQARILRKTARHLIFVPDNDTAGMKSLARVREVLSGADLRIAELPAKVKDAGEMSYDQAHDFMQRILSK